jgi:hypothetical protein
VPEAFDALGYLSIIFSLDRGKILILLQLAGGGLPCGVQNLDSMGLVGKIFRNKGLDTAAGLFR